MVAAPHALAAQAGAAMLEGGGNAADAILSVAATLSVVYPHMTGIGGDAFFLYYDARSGRVYAYNGSGAAANLATQEHYAALGHTHIPERGPHAALTVPGTVDAWFALHERFGSRSMEQILAPAVSYARQGVPAAPSVARACRELAAALSADPPATQLVLRDGSAGRALLENPRLADALEKIGREGRRWFYEAEGAQAIGKHAERIGSPLRAEDLAAHRGLYCEPAGGQFFGYESLTTPPNSQGLALLVAQQTYQAYAREKDLPDGSPAQVHAAAECVRLAVADRDAVVTDPMLGEEWRRVLSEDNALAHARRIRPDETSGPKSVRQDSGGTCYFACVDAHGNCVSFIQSLFHHFGAAVLVPELGMFLNNRGISFDLSGQGVRQLVPRRRPFHTLMPCMLVRDGKPALVYGSMGGDAQPQIGLQISTRIVVDREDPQQAIERPRWRWTRDAPDKTPRLYVEARIGQACIAGLRTRGHDVEVLGDWEESMGHASAIWIDRAEGVLTGGCDPRSDGAAVGI
ncbi:MAG TPA: gamma-glutamyltransferase family protein [Candidatus Acidoferrales bacterium]|nr:gamma-glutamyltransferase family protein [Candidatus Acidoferrales bacterium]